jgi:hypothetical protein
MPQNFRSEYGGGRMKIEHLLEFICAAHVAQQIESPWLDRGGIGLVAEPGQLKTTLAEKALGAYFNVKVLSDVNVVELGNLRGDLATNRFRTIVFLDFQKLYERNQDTASNIEGTLRALTGEGWQGLPHESAMSGMPGRAFVVICITPKMFRRKGGAWNDSGFARRFIWLQYAISNPEVKIDAMNRWEKVSIGDVRIPWPAEKLPMRNTESENQMCRQMLKDQPGKDDSIQFQILARTYQILKWHYKARRGNERRTPDEIFQGLSALLSRTGGELVLSGPELVKRRQISA